MNPEIEKYKSKLARAEEKVKILEEMVENSTRELYLKNQALERQNKELEQFTYISSHDLQEPLRTISSLVDFIHTRYNDQLDDMAKKSFVFINQATARMRNLILGLLDYSRLGKEKELQAIDCNVMVQEVLGDLGDAATQSGATIHVERLPEITGYEVDLRLLFQNLLSNAFKFRHPDRTPRVTISARQTNSHWQFDVADNGIGIEDQYKSKIFVIFQRLHARDEYGGIGIGLAHCKKIVDLHNGEIWVNSKIGEGSTFHFTIQQKTAAI